MYIRLIILLSVGERSNREGTYVYLWLIHVGVWQKTTQFCKAIILQLKNKLKNISQEKKIDLVVFFI